MTTTQSNAQVRWMPDSAPDPSLLELRLPEGERPFANVPQAELEQRWSRLKQAADATKKMARLVETELARRALAVTSVHTELQASPVGCVLARDHVSAKICLEHIVGVFQEAEKTRASADVIFARRVLEIMAKLPEAEYHRRTVDWRFPRVFQAVYYAKKSEVEAQAFDAEVQHQMDEEYRELCSY
jgi:hypothetical protein